MQNPSIVRTKSRAASSAPARELSWTFILLVIVCTCVVATGFFFAARQHFTSMDYGIKNSKLREQLRSLEAEKRRLLLAREVASSPVAIRKAARGLGLHQSSAEMAAIPVTARKPASKDPVATPIVAKGGETKSEQHRVVRTVMTAPAEAKPTSGEGRSRIVEAKKEKKDKSEVAALLKLR
jgi:hypothetical protein